MHLVPKSRQAPAEVEIANEAKSITNVLVQAINCDDHNRAARIRNASNALARIIGNWL